MPKCQDCKHYNKSDSFCSFFKTIISNETCEHECLHYKKAEGKKYDTGKNCMGLMCENFSRALWEVGKISTFGKQKYGINTWQKLDNPKDRYMDALCRHLFQHLQGKKVDDESGLLHLAAVVWNGLALLEFELKEEDENLFTVEKAKELLGIGKNKTKYIVKNEDYEKYIGLNAIYVTDNKNKILVKILAFDKDSNTFKVENLETKDIYNFIKRDSLIIEGIDN